MRSRGSGYHRRAAVADVRSTAVLVSLIVSSFFAGCSSNSHHTTTATHLPKSIEGNRNSDIESKTLQHVSVAAADVDDQRDEDNEAIAVANNKDDDFLTFCTDFEKGAAGGLSATLSGSSRDYRVVAVTGCQCSGKSTLLNALFGTGFPVLERTDDTLPRRTTVGAWVDLQLCSPPRKQTKHRSKPRKDTAADSVAAATTTTQKATGVSSTTGKRRTASKERGRTIRSAAAAASGSAKGGEEIDRDMSPSSASAKSVAVAEHGGGDGGGSAAVADNHSSQPDAAQVDGPSAIAPTPFVLIDVEGTQSRHRGPNGAEFDSRTTLFAVMASDVIVLNLWAHDVGRADGQAYSVLRSVFEEAVRLYDRQGRGINDKHNGNNKESVGVSPGENKGKEGGGEIVGGPARFPKVLMLVMRDVEDDDQYEALEKAARANMEALWRGVEKPISLRDASLSEVFDLRTAGLPHFKYQRREFASKAADLGRRFLDPSHGGFVFPRARRRRENKDHLKNGVKNGERSEGSAGSDGGGQKDQGVGSAAVPLSMMRRRLEEIWACAKANDRLADVPRRDRRAGAVAAAAMAESCLTEARPKCATLLSDVEAAAGEMMPLLQFGSDAQRIFDEALLSFQSRVSKSQPPLGAPVAVLKEKRAWLVAALARELEPAFSAHARHLRAHFHDQFEEAFSCVLGGAPDFDASSKGMSKSARAGFLDATKLAVPDVPGVAEVWRLHWEAELVKLNSDMENRVQDRLSEGTWMLPPDPAELQAAAAKKKMPWWKGLILRAAAMYFNYLQATQHMRRAKKDSEKREKAVPRFPLF